MATRYWRGTTSTDHANINNWSDSSDGPTPASSVPGAGDTAIIDGGGVDEIQLSANWTLSVFDVQDTFGFSVSLSSFTLTVNGNANIENTDEFDMGSGRLYVVGGTFTFQNASLTSGTGKLQFGGTCTINSQVDTFYDIIIDSGATLTTHSSTSTVGASHLLTIGDSSTLSISTGKTFQTSQNCDATIGAGASVSGLGTFNLQQPTNTHGLISIGAGAVINVSTFKVTAPATGSKLAAYTYDSAQVTFLTTSITGSIVTQTGNYVFNGNVKIQSITTGTLTLDNSTNGPSSIKIVGNLTIDIDSTGNVVINDSGKTVNWLIQGNIVNEDTGAGSFTWTKGNGTVTAIGSANATWTPPGTQTLADLVIARTGGTLTFGSNFTTDSFTAITGAMDFNGKAITVSGDMTIGPGSSIDTAADSMNAAAIVVGGNLLLEGTSNSLLTMNATAGWTLNVTGSAIARHVSVQRSDASAGVDVLAQMSTNGGNNTGWVFETSASSDDASAQKVWLKRRRRF